MSDRSPAMLEWLERAADEAGLAMVPGPDWDAVLTRAHAETNGNGALRGTHGAGRWQRAELVPLDEAATGELTDIGGRARTRRPLLLAATLAATLVALLVTPLGGAIARGLGDFSDWLSGAVGEPADSQSQEAFDDENARRWSGFPTGTELRTLIHRRVDGIEYTLVGFRARGELCLRLVAPGARAVPYSCTPVRSAERPAAAVIVVRADETIGPAIGSPDEHGYRAVTAQATFGIAADGIADVVLETDQDKRVARVENNAFLDVNPRPPLGTRVRSVTALSDKGEAAPVPFVVAPFGDYPSDAPRGTPQGPDRVEMRLPRGHVQWITNGEPRGVPPPKRLLEETVSHTIDPTFARAVRPDPALNAYVLVATGRMSAPFSEPRTVTCVFLFAADRGDGGGCSPPNRLFEENGHIVSWLLIPHGGDQHSSVHGLVSDAVERLAVFFASGQRLDVPVKDNAFVVEAPRAAYPARLVAYDQDGRVIAIQDVSEGRPPDTASGP